MVRGVQCGHVGQVGQGVVRGVQCGHVSQGDQGGQANLVDGMVSVVKVVIFLSGWSEW